MSSSTLFLNVVCAEMLWVECVSVHLLAGLGFICRTRPLLVGGLSTRSLSSVISVMGFILLASLVVSIYQNLNFIFSFWVYAVSAFVNG